MKMELKYFVERNRQYVDVCTGEPVGLKFDEHTIIASVNSQVFRDVFIVTEETKINNDREEAYLFGQKLVEIGRMIKKQAKQRPSYTTVTTTGQRFTSF